jgi:uncharacterized protein DUF1648
MGETDRALRTFFAIMAAALIFIYYTSQSMPEMIASHFNSAGVPTGFVPRHVYFMGMLVVILVAPLLLVILPRLAMRNPNVRINVPNREYWLTPERRPYTVNVICQQSTRFASMLMLFLCYAHWLVVHANASMPPSLSSGWLLAGLVVFMGLTVRWAFGLIAHFRVPEEE